MEQQQEEKKKALSGKANNRTLFLSQQLLHSAGARERTTRWPFGVCASPVSFCFFVLMFFMEVAKQMANVWKKERRKLCNPTTKWKASKKQAKGKEKERKKRALNYDDHSYCSPAPFFFLHQRISSLGDGPFFSVHEWTNASWRRLPKKKKKKRRRKEDNTQAQNNFFLCVCVWNPQTHLQTLRMYTNTSLVYTCTHDTTYTLCIHKIHRHSIPTRHTYITHTTHTQHISHAKNSRATAGEKILPPCFANTKRETPKKSRHNGALLRFCRGEKNNLCVYMCVWEREFIHCREKEQQNILWCKTEKKKTSPKWFLNVYV